MAKAAKRDPNFIHFLCARCRAPATAPLKLAGRFIDCPQCKSKSPVPATQQEADEDAIDIDVQQHSYEVVDGKCFKCAKKMGKGAVICVKCGFNHRDGKQLTTVDQTVKEDEPLRGKPAMTNMILCLVIGVVLLGVMAWRILDDSAKIWWEQAIYLTLSTFLLSLIPPLYLQWNSYRTLPIRDYPGVKEENKAEQAEAMNPYDSYTALVLLLCLAVGFGAMIAAFSRDPDTKKFVWPWDAQDSVVAPKKK